MAFESLWIALFLIVTAAIVILALYTWYYAYRREQEIRRLGEE